METTMRHLLVSLILVLAGASAARAQSVPYAYPYTVGTSPVQVLTTNPVRKRIKFYNPNATAKVAFCPKQSRIDSSNITCAVNGAGSITLVPLASFEIDGCCNPTAGLPSPWNAVADTAGSAITIFEWE
jgi:hypothetical protein